MGTARTDQSDAGVRGISLDAFTVKYLGRYLTRIDAERDAYGDDHPNHGLLVVWPDGTPLHPDTITRRFNRLVDKAGVRRIRLHDVRHTYATLSMDEGVDAKLLADRLGHDLATLLKVYTHRTRGRDRGIAQQMGSKIESALEGDESETSATESATDHTHKDQT